MNKFRNVNSKNRTDPSVDVPKIFEIIDENIYNNYNDR